MTQKKPDPNQESRLPREIILAAIPMQSRIQDFLFADRQVVVSSQFSHHSSRFFCHVHFLFFLSHSQTCIRYPDVVYYVLLYLLRLHSNGLQISMVVGDSDFQFLISLLHWLQYCRVTGTIWIVCGCRCSSFQIHGGLSKLSTHEIGSGTFDDVRSSHNLNKGRVGGVL